MKKIYFYILTVFFAAAVFVGNYQHRAEQGIYRHRYLVLADNLSQGIGYIYQAGDREPAFYPIWGYSLLITLIEPFINPDIGLIVLQFILACHGIFIFYKIFNIEKRFWQIPLFLPYFAVCSVKWPNAVESYLIILISLFCYKFIQQGRFRFAILGGLLIGLIANFRSEYSLFPFSFLVSSVLIRKRSFRSKTLILGISILLIEIILLLPWAVRSFKYDGKIRFTATNFGCVLYITLGQLPHNPWHRVHDDRAAYKYVELRGEDEAMTTRGNQLLIEAFIKDIKKYPGAYAEKWGYNLLSSLIGGVYYGEFGNLVESDREVARLVSIKKKDGLIAFARAMSPPGFLIRVLKNIFKVIWLALIAIFVRSFWSQDIKLYRYALAPIVIYKFFIISFLQYQPRHLTTIYLLLLGFGLLMIKLINENKSST